MNKKLQTTTLLSLTALMVLSGCATDNPVREKDVQKTTMELLKKDKSYQAYDSVQSEKKKEIFLQERNRWIYPIVKRIAKRYKIPLDRSFIPSQEYRIDANIHLDLQGFLDLIYRQTGVRYSIEDGVMKVRNNELVEPYENTSRRCSKKSQYSIALKSAPLSQLFAPFAQKGYSVEYDLKYFNLDNRHPTLSYFKNITFNYKGCSPREALKKFGKEYDLKIILNKKKKHITVMDYDVLEVNMPQPFNMTYSSGSSNIGSSQGSGGLQLNDKEDTEKSIQGLISSVLSKRGKAYVSKRGYVSVTDTPESIKRIRKVLKKELNAQQNIKLKITIVSVELNDKYSSGVDWNGVIQNLSNAQTGISAPISDATGAFTLNGSNDVLKTLSFLGEYGKSKINTQYTINTRSGIVSSLKSVDIIPYTTSSVTTDGGIAQTNKEAKSIESGIILNIKPTLDKGYVNLNIDASLSQYLGDKDVGDGYILPLQKDNKVQTHITTKLGETAILSGLKLRSNSRNYKGIPKMQNTTLLNTLSGSNDDTISTKEYLIFITPIMSRG